LPGQIIAIDIHGAKLL